MKIVKNKLSVYLESSVISYCANKISSDLKVAAEQKITQDWFCLDIPRIGRTIQKNRRAGFKTRAAEILSCVATHARIHKRSES